MVVPYAEGFAAMQAISIQDIFAENENIDQVEFDQVETEAVIDEQTQLNMYFADSVLGYGDKFINANKQLSEKEINFIKSHSVMSATDIVYHLLSKFTSMPQDEQINTYISCLNYLASKRIPKDYIGGFSILMIKYHYLP